jgi:pimeloyl-ACP methyl ester carboxylesterase
MKTIEHFIPNEDGWRLSLFQSWNADRLVRGRNPVLIVPGYGMNSFIFSYHPSGLSLEGYLAEAGYEVWRADLRGQGNSASLGGGHDYRLEDLALTDLGAAIRAALERSHTRAERVDVIGASLGGTIMFIHAALNPDNRLGSLVAMGTPVRWVEIHPVLELLSRSPSLIGMVRLRGTRRLAEIALPRMMRLLPSALSVYMNAGITDVSAAREMVKTVEDPNQSVNRQIARWICDRDLMIRDTNLSTAIRSIQNPLLCVIAKDDGIVPRRTAEFPYLTVTSPVRSLLEVGMQNNTVAHADLFVSNVAQERVFEPIAGWLASPGV